MTTDNANEAAWEEYQQTKCIEDYLRNWDLDKVLSPTAHGTAGNTQAERDALPLWDYMFGYFPDAFLEEVAVAVSGNRQHNPGETGIRWARGKSMDHKNKFFRHVWDHSRGIKKDTDGTWHLAKAIWRLKAWLQEEIEEERRKEVEEYAD